ncbi:MAG: monofunctional biosynthetic peptidoglycan transglycosylase [Acidobacteriota bacterium]
MKSAAGRREVRWARPKKRVRTRLSWRRILLWLVMAFVAWFGLCLASLVLMKWVTPPVTMVQAQRRVESWFGKGKYEKRQTVVELKRISPELQHAVIAAEDGRFYQHHGIDFEELGKIYEDVVEDGEPIRGGSTITQQLVKNLFFTTHGNPLRKVAEFGMAPAADWILGKQRVLELYLNVIEWGPGVFGAEAAARYHYKTSAAALNRDQAARLAAVIPLPRRRRPARMDSYAGIIEKRMAMMGW